jgi:hypothetical protein
MVLIANASTIVRENITSHSLSYQRRGMRDF